MKKQKDELKEKKRGFFATLGSKMKEHPVITGLWVVGIGCLSYGIPKAIMDLSGPSGEKASAQAESTEEIPTEGAILEALNTEAGTNLIVTEAITESVTESMTEAPTESDSQEPTETIFAKTVEAGKPEDVKAPGGNAGTDTKAENKNTGNGGKDKNTGSSGGSKNGGSSSNGSTGENGNSGNNVGTVSPGGTTGNNGTGNGGSSGGTSTGTGGNTSTGSTGGTQSGGTTGNGGTVSTGGSTGGGTSNPGGSSGGNSGGTNTGSTEAHQHTWVAKYETVHHDAVYEDYTIPAYDEDVWAGHHSFCNGCGLDLTITYGTAACAEAGTHLSNCNSGYHTADIYETVHHDEESGTKLVKEAYDEEKYVDDVCSGCGMTYDEYYYSKYGVHLYD